jgi:DNA polymerase-3 subunit gamma/tau
MKIAGLGKKKNDGSPIGLSMEDFTLPDLPDRITPIASTSVTPPTPQPAPQPAPSGATTVTTPATREPVESRIEPRVEPKSEQRIAPATANTAPNGNHTPPSTASHTTVSGPSIADLMRGVATASQQPEDEDTPSTSSEQVVIDARSEAKVNAVKDRVIKDILQERPRFVVAFENMQVDGHRIKVEVPTTQLYEEIIRSRTEILMQIAQTAGVTGMLELEITINEQIKASRPIKLEDRIRFMTERNENILELKRLLDMEYE